MCFAGVAAVVAAGRPSLSERGGRRKAARSSATSRRPPRTPRRSIPVSPSPSLLSSLPPLAIARLHLVPPLLFPNGPLLPLSPSPPTPLFPVSPTPPTPSLPLFPSSPSPHLPPFLRIRPPATAPSERLSKAHLAHWGRSLARAATCAQQPHRWQQPATWHALLPACALFDPVLMGRRRQEECLCPHSNERLGNKMGVDVHNVDMDEELQHLRHLQHLHLTILQTLPIPSPHFLLAFSLLPVESTQMTPA
ncbi:unnamed protein product [Closterium sp. NIES-64]|nr:unnamed protein product [Closterium sp. NIES-64]